MSPFLRHEWLFCYSPTFSCRYALSRVRDNNILRIAIARCLNDEKVGAVKIAGQENVSPVYPFFFLPHPKRRYASSADSKRELRPGHDSRNYILRDNSIMLHGWRTHAFAPCWYATCTVLLRGDVFSTVSLQTTGGVFAGKTRAHHRYCRPYCDKERITPQENRG